MHGVCAIITKRVLHVTYGQMNYHTWIIISCSCYIQQLPSKFALFGDCQFHVNIESE